ncbi:MAG: hypothetical protein U5N55_09120 [Cypionkella sp.]|nr:hypothetical protein [Cypionkella sp.]
MPTARPLLFSTRGVSALRRHAIARQPHFRLARLLRAIPQGAVYFNVGHCNLSVASLTAIGRAGLSRAVLIHDTIPLDHPDFARAGTHAAFAAKIAAVAQHSDIALHISRDARAKTEGHFASLWRASRTASLRPLA